MRRTDRVQEAGCPCGLPAPYSLCCGRWHDGPLRLQAPDAERLMRSRYCAYVLRRTDYLLLTWHPRFRPSTLAPGPAALKWLGLDVRRHVQLDETHAEVEFVARCQENGRASRLHEISRFERLDGFWMYVDGVAG